MRNVISLVFSLAVFVAALYFGLGIRAPDDKEICALRCCNGCSEPMMF